MNKTWEVLRQGSYKTYEDAETRAKKDAAKMGNDYIVFEAVAIAKAVVPPIEVVKL